MPTPLSDDKMAALTDALLTGQKIEAIKLYRESTGLGLKESKDEIEKIEASLRTQFPDKFPVRKNGCLGAAVVFGLCGFIVVYWPSS